MERARRGRACRRGPRPWAQPDQQHMADVMRVVGQTSTPFVVTEYRYRLCVTGYRSVLLVLVDVVRAMSSTCPVKSSRVRGSVIVYAVRRREVRMEHWRELPRGPRGILNTQSLRRAHVQERNRLSLSTEELVHHRRTGEESYSICSDRSSALWAGGSGITQHGKTREPRTVAQRLPRPCKKKPDPHLHHSHLSEVAWAWPWGASTGSFAVRSSCLVFASCVRCEDAWVAQGAKVSYLSGRHVPVRRATYSVIVNNFQFNRRSVSRFCG